MQHVRKPRKQPVGETKYVTGGRKSGRCPLLHHVRVVSSSSRIPSFLQPHRHVLIGFLPQQHLNFFTPCSSLSCFFSSTQTAMQNFSGHLWTDFTLALLARDRRRYSPVWRTRITGFGLHCGANCRQHSVFPTVYGALLTTHRVVLAHVMTD